MEKVDYRKVINYSDVCKILASDQFLIGTEYYSILFNKFFKETDPVIRLLNIIRVLNHSKFNTFRPCCVIMHNGIYGIFYPSSIKNALLSEELAMHLIRYFSIELEAVYNI